MMIPLKHYVLMLSVFVLFPSFQAWASTVTARTATVTLNEGAEQQFSVTAFSSNQREKITISIVTQPRYGNLTVMSGKTLKYTPTSANYYGTDVATYRARSSSGSYANGTINFTLLAVNDSPTASNVSASTNEDTAIAVTLLGADVDTTDSLIYSLTQTTNANGMATISDTNRLTYTPTAEFNGTSTIQYSVSDGIASSSSATVTISVVSVNDAPVAMSQSASLDENTSVTVTLSGSDIDDSASSLVYSIASMPAHGTLVRESASDYKYTPSLDFFGTDSFTYTANDGSLSSSPATVTMTVIEAVDYTLMTVQKPGTDQPVADLNGVVSGPIATGGFLERDMSEQLRYAGRTGIRNNDDGSGVLDMETMFNCTGEYGGECTGDNGRMGYPCWKGCTPLSAEDPSLLFSPTQQQPNVPDSDGQVMALLDAGFEPFLRMGGSYSEGNLNGDVSYDNCSTSATAINDGYSFRGPQGEEEEDNTLIAGKFIIEHFLAEFGSENFTYINAPITEYLNQHFFDRDEYSGCGAPGNDGLDLFIAKHIDGYKQFFPDKKIVAPGVHGDTTYLSNKNLGAAYQFLNAMWNYRYSYNTQLDALDVHYFGIEPKLAYVLPLALRGLLDGTAGTAGGYSWNHTDKPWAGTDYWKNTGIVWGAYHTGADRAETTEEAVALTSGSLGAAIQTAYYIGMQNSGLVERAYWYRGIDQGVLTDLTKQSTLSGVLYSQPETCSSNYPVCDTNHSPYKPIAHAMRFQGILLQEFPQLLTNPTPEGVENESLWWVGGEEADGNRKAILISNTGDTALPFKVQYSNGSTSTPMNSYSIKLYQVDDTNTGNTPVFTADKGYTGTLSIPAKTTQLLILTP